MCFGRHDGLFPPDFGACRSGVLHFGIRGVQNVAVLDESVNRMIGMRAGRTTHRQECRNGSFIRTF
jgi:hypothetical protein